MSCDLTSDIINIESILEAYIADWMLDLKNNIGLLRNIEEIYPESTIVSNNVSSESKMYSMADEMARIKYTAAPLYATAISHKGEIDTKLLQLCAARDQHENLKNAWTAYRNGLDPLDPDYVTNYNTATTYINESASAEAAKEAERSALYTAANPIVEAINAEFTELARGVLKSRYYSNRSVGTIIESDLEDTSGLGDTPDDFYVVNSSTPTTAYALTALNKIGKWSEYAQSLDIATKLKSITFNGTVSNGTGSFSSTIDALSARDAAFNDDSELVVTSEMEYKPALIAAYGPEFISAVDSCESDISTEYSFLQQLLVSTVSGLTATYTITASPSWSTTSATFETASWYTARNNELDPLPDPYDPSVPAFVPNPPA